MSVVTYIESKFGTFWRYKTSVLERGIKNKRKTSLTLDAELLDSAKALDINVSAVAEAVLRNAVASARQAQWLKQNAEAFEAQAARHERHGHPLADIISAPGGSSWKIGVRKLGSDPNFLKQASQSRVV